MGQQGISEHETLGLTGRRRTGCRLIVKSMASGNLRINLDSTPAFAGLVVPACWGNSTFLPAGQWPSGQGDQPGNRRTVQLPGGVACGIASSFLNEKQPGMVFLALRPSFSILGRSPGRGHCAAFKLYCGQDIVFLYGPRSFCRAGLRKPAAGYAAHAVLPIEDSDWRLVRARRPCHQPDAGQGFREKESGVSPVRKPSGTAQNRLI
jgi:hypothetical protein